MYVWLVLRKAPAGPLEYSGEAHTSEDAAKASIPEVLWSVPDENGDLWAEASDGTVYQIQKHQSEGRPVSPGPLTTQ